MSEKKDLTMSQLAQIALGCPSLGNINIALLHTIINLTLKKLNCENEKITLIGEQAENLHKLIQKSTSGPTLIFDDQNIKTPMKAYDKLSKLEEKVNILECNLEYHLAGTNFPVITNMHCLSKSYQKCEVEEQQNQTISRLLRNETFLGELKKRMCWKMTCRFNKLDIELTELTYQIEEFKKQCCNVCECLNAVAKLATDLEDLRTLIDQYRSEFKKTLNEIQASFDSKVNNCDIRSMKVEFREMLDKATASATEYINAIKKPHAISAYYTISLEDKDIQKKHILIDQSPRNYGAAICECGGLPTEKQTPLLEHIKSLDLHEIIWRMEADKYSFQL